MGNSEGKLVYDGSLLNGGKFGDHRSIDYIEWTSSTSKRIWKVKKLKNFNNEQKNATLFEYDSSSCIGNDNTETKKKLALNHIKAIKKLRHPNVVKYFHDEESSLLNQNNNSRGYMYLITESIRPMRTVIGELNLEQIKQGLFSITNALCFLHSRAQISHNNLSTECIYLNLKQTWKLNDLELALSFDDLNKENLVKIYDFKHKQSITPEEEKLMQQQQLAADFSVIKTTAPHAIDAYGWAQLVMDLVGDSINQQQEYENEFQDFLNKDPLKRPKLDMAFNLRFFASYKRNNNNNTSSSAASPTTTTTTIGAAAINKFDYYLNKINNTSNQAAGVDLNLFDLSSRIDNLQRLEENWPGLVRYLSSYICPDDSSPTVEVNETLIDFLLSPIIFFSEKASKQILPCVLIPKSTKSNNNNNNVNSSSYHFPMIVSGDLNADSKTNFDSFISADTYKALVLPKILNLFPIHITQIRVNLLKYFPFYLSYITDKETLQYEILPELLLGLKDTNDEVVSLTLSCLSAIVKLIGADAIFTSHNSNSIFKKNTRRKLFSDNLPKTMEIIMKKQQSVSGINPSDEHLLKEETKYEAAETPATVSCDDSDSLSSVKIKNINNNNQENELKNVNSIAAADWSNDNDEEWDEIKNTPTPMPIHPTETSPEEAALSAEINNQNEPAPLSIYQKQKSLTAIKKPQSELTDQIISHLDIKSINIKRIETEEDDLINGFLNEMQPVIKPALKMIDISNNANNNNNNNNNKINNKTAATAKNSETTTSKLYDYSNQSNNKDMNVNGNGGFGNGVSGGGSGVSWDVEDVDIDLDNL